MRKNIFNTIPIQMITALVINTLLITNFAFAQHDHTRHATPTKNAAEKIQEIAPAHSMASHDMNDDPLLTYLKIDQLEWRDAQDNEFAWNTEAWIGYNTNKLWLKTEGEKTADKTEHSEIQLLYSRSISAFWDLQTGLRVDVEPQTKKRATNHWLALGFQGLAPYFIETDSTLFFGESGNIAWRLKLEQEWMLTQKLALVPKTELKFYGQNNRDYEQGSGLSETEIGLRLQYQIKRNIAPYIGLQTFKKHGNTAAYTRDKGEDTDDAQLAIGLHAWF
jgi:copper resistance protein B